MDNSSTTRRGPSPLGWACIALIAGYVIVASIMLAVGGQPWWLVPGAVALVVLGVFASVTVRTANSMAACRQALADEFAAQREVQELFLQYMDAYSQGLTPTALPEEPPRPEAAEQYERMKSMVDNARNAYEAQRSAVHSAVVSLARKVQTSAHRMQEEAGRMVSRHPNDPDVLETSMRVDHAAAQQARYAQSLAALCGERPGQQWNEALALSDVVRGAAGRITAYQRVEASGDPAIAVTARVVEPLIHIVSELLANAAQSSPPTTNVLVTLRHVQRGAVIEIDDCGVGMDDRRLEQARRIASGEEVHDLFTLGEVPQTGLPSVGTYARRYGFRVDLGESVYGGVRAIVMVPSELTEPLPPGHAAMSGQLALTRQHYTADNLKPVVKGAAPTQTAPQSQQLPLPDPTPVATEQREEPKEAPVAPSAPQADLPVLPRRKSRRGEAVVVENSSEITMDIPAVPADPQQAAEQAGQWMSAFLSSDTSNRSAATQNPPSASRDISEE
ncbi:ATP-binding protein [Saccharomonospora sp. NB11]|uniref:ATP-binding protein n=1 Tax=Saccharomonospora sp. NB11 TaxID=1642298 RepID=UPI0018D0B6A3|nr:ATP-binding protein [Saccharomonospora sp. NB11]